MHQGAGSRGQRVRGQRDTSDDFTVFGSGEPRCGEVRKGSSRDAEVEGKTKTPDGSDRFTEVYRFRLSKIGRSAGRGQGWYAWDSQTSRVSIHDSGDMCTLVFLATPLGRQRTEVRRQTSEDRRQNGRGQRGQGDRRWEIGRVPPLLFASATSAASRGWVRRRGHSEKGDGMHVVLRYTFAAMLVTQGTALSSGVPSDEIQYFVDRGWHFECRRSDEGHGKRAVWACQVEESRAMEFLSSLPEMEQLSIVSSTFEPGDVRSLAQRCPSVSAVHVTGEPFYSLGRFRPVAQPLKAEIWPELMEFRNLKRLSVENS